MSGLVMTGAEMREAYPNGMDEDDMAAWELAVERNCEHDEAISVYRAVGRAVVYCPCCGVEVDAKALDEQRAAEWEMYAIQRAEQAVGA